MILLISFVCGVVVGTLTFLGTRNVALAVLAGVGTLGGAIATLNKLIS